MTSPSSLNLFQANFLLSFLLLITFIGNAQDIQIEVLGGSVIIENSTIAISAGNAVNFRITTTAANCGALRIEDIILSNAIDFSVSHSTLPSNVKASSCRNGDKFLDFTVTNISGVCDVSTDVTIVSNSDPNFLFTFTINGAPEINVLGGSPSADVIHGSTTTSSSNGTYYGVVEEGVTEIRYFIIANTGSCPLDILTISSSLADFVVPPYVVLPDGVTPSGFTTSIDPGSYVILPVTFIAPITDPKTTGTLTSTISISNSDNTTFTFNVSAEMFDFNIPGPGGITADFRLWLKTTRGVTKDGSSKVSGWADIGTNGKDAIQPVSANQPTYIDNATSNINFNPVIEFENDGSTISQYLYNADNGFYSQDIFIVMESDVAVASSTGMTIFSGSISDIILPENYVDDVNDVTGVGLGGYTTNLTGERLWYNQGSSDTNPYYALPASSSRAYSEAGIINAGNKSATVSDGMRILYNSIDDALAPTETLTTFENVGYVDTVPDPDYIWGTPFIIGKNANTTLGNLNGRVAEIFTFAERVSDADRQKIESYLAIKYGVTLGASNEAGKDYINSFGTSVWDISMNTGYNYHVAGIGKDSISDLNQKQSKTLNTSNEVTIGLGGIYTANSSNTNEFVEDGDFLVWGNNNDAFTGSNSNTVTIASGITTTLTRIDRKWKIIESTEVASDVGNVYVSIPSAAFSSFTLGTDEEYALIVADNANFANSHIIDVIPLESDGGTNLQTWYDFDNTKYFTFGKVSKLSENHSINIASGDYLVGENSSNLNINDFTISAWVKGDAAQTSTRTIMAKGSKLQLRLNSSHQIEMMVDDDSTPRFTSSMTLNDNKWHQISFVYDSGTIFLYVDGVLDKSEQNVVAPSPNYNRFSVGAVYIDKDNIINPFLGEIDEVYVWDQGLTEGQVRYLMNQEIEKGTGEFVSGKIIPQSASSNEIAAIPWNKLKAYYDFNSFYGSTVEGVSDNRSFLRLKYLDKDKSVVGSQTVPVPYISSADGAWGDSSTWSNNTDLVLPNSLSLDGVTYIDWNIVETTHNITSGDKDITVLGLINTSGTITIADPTVTSPIENNDGQSLRVTHYLEIDGVIDLVGESQLVQDEGSVLDADSGGYLERDQQGTANGFNYNYWSSSVGPITGNTATSGTGIENTNSNYTVSGVLMDGTDSSSYQNITFNPTYSAADSDTPSNPRVISSYWFYKFYGPSKDYDSWVSLNENSALLPGEGYTMKGTSGSVDIVTNQNYVFKGLPNNGDVTLALDKSGGDVERLIGNPYSSAIDADEFILDNIKTTDTINGDIGRNSNNVINGALYFWHHFGDVDSHYLSGYVGGYATYTLMGGTEAYSIDSLIDNSTPEVGGGKVPEKYIPVGQGFFVSTLLPSGISGTTSTVDGGTITFKNSQRVFVREGYTGINDGSLFFKTGTKTKTKQPIVNSDERQKIRLKFTSSTGYQRQLLMGVDENATDTFDLGYDAPLADINKDDMYWLFDAGKFVIQGVNSINESQEFPFGITVSKSGLVSIKIDTVENLDENIGVYILDKETGVTSQINTDSFEIYLDAGDYTERFSLVFKAQNNITRIDRKTTDFLLNTDSEKAELNISNLSDVEVIDVDLYNFQGQKLGSFDFTTKKISIPVNFSKGIYILHFNTVNGVVTKKVVL